MCFRGAPILGAWRIPSTWRKWGSDATDDGTADPNNIIDAAYSAGRYLCASGRDLHIVSANMISEYPA